MRIWKWTLDVTDEQILQMPGGAEILCVQIQNGVPQLWALCDETALPTPRRIGIYGTGHPIPDAPGRHVGTFAIREGQLVFHVFEAYSAT